MRKSEHHIRLLRDEFLKRRSKNTSYSMRAFARHLRLSPARLCQILNGKRDITVKQIESIADSLELSPSRKKTLLEQSGKVKIGKTKKNAVKYAEVDLDQFKFISDWYHSALLCLIRTEGFKADTKFIANRLNISTVEVTEALERLEKLKLIKKEGGDISLLEENVTIGANIASPALRKLHKQMLEKAAGSIEDIDLSLRDISSITMAIDPTLLPQAKQLITTFRRQLCAFLETGNQKNVYAFNMQLFPLSKIEGPL